MEQVYGDKTKCDKKEGRGEGGVERGGRATTIAVMGYDACR